MLFCRSTTLAICFASVSAFHSTSFKSLGYRKTSRTLPRCQVIAVPLQGNERKRTLSSNTKTRNVLQKESRWVEKLDYAAFTKDVYELGRKLRKDQGEDDVKHLNKVLLWRDLAAVVGLSTMWVTPNPITIIALSTWTYASWTMVAHHTCHGGYNRVDAGKYNSRGFAIGSLQKRIEDWCDWMMPEAWNVEHNRLHHYHLGEVEDPDLVQNNLGFLREMEIAMPLKYLIVAALIPIWKWFYYAPNTFKELQISKWQKEGKEFPKDFNPYDASTIATMLFESSKAANEVIKPKEFFTTVIGPFFLSRFILLPAPLLLLPAGPDLFVHGVINLLMADLLTNIHGFTTIVTNHAGDDVYMFKGGVKPQSGAFFVRQIAGSVNYDAGNDFIDFSHGWLNYQIEHHVWPDLSMLQYQRGAPKLKAICEKHGVPYIQQSVWQRLQKTVDIMVGRNNMREFPVEFEPEKDKAVHVTWKSTNGAIDDYEK